MARQISGILIVALCGFYPQLMGQGPVDPESVTDKVICGYQGWFACKGDSSPLNFWFHWAGLTTPSAGNLHFESYPDVSMYEDSDLFLTGFASQGDGNPSRLFSSYKENVVNTHFALMQNHGIDGVALQRFACALTDDPVFLQHNDSIAVRVKRAAEEYSRIFYVMYDISGMAASDFGMMQTDWQNNIGSTLQLTSSPMYAHQYEMPVVCIWGFGFAHTDGTAAQCIAVIEWFQNQGCFVIGGVPAGWRTCTGASKPGFEDVYRNFNMISPWTVGAYTNLVQVDDYKTDFLIPDLAYCISNEIAYQPVVFPGSAASNWGNGIQNHTPRIQGEFMWQQVTNIESLGITSMYVAMFDEYDEATAILSTADGYDMIPTNQYFLTTSADGVYISPDFYLRLTGNATRVIKGIDPATENVTIPFSSGPVYFRTSLEADIDPLPSWTENIEIRVDISAYGSNFGDPSCDTSIDVFHRGTHSLRIEGRDLAQTDGSCVYFKVFDVDIPVNANTQLHFWTYPENELGRYVSIDLIMTDNTTLRDCGAVDINGVLMHPADGRGSVGTWTKTTCDLGNWLADKTIDRILVAYDHVPETGDFRAFIDDISIDTGFLVPACSWTGLDDTDWFNALNWGTETIPTDTTDIYISFGALNAPLINSSEAKCRDVNTNTTISINTNESLAVHGNWTDNGELVNPISGTVVFEGAEQVIDGTNIPLIFNNMIINSSISTTLNTHVILTGNIVINSDNILLIAPGKSLTVEGETP
jgi:hypothetical protein